MLNELLFSIFEFASSLQIVDDEEQITPVVQLTVTTAGRSKAVTAANECL